MLGPTADQSELELFVLLPLLQFVFWECSSGANLWLFLVSGWPGEGKGGRGYVSSLSGLLTGLPPFMTTGSLVVLLEGGPPASLGTASPTSCNEGSRYIATRGMEEEKKRKKRKMWGEQQSEGWRGEERENKIEWEIYMNRERERERWEGAWVGKEGWHKGKRKKKGNRKQNCSSQIL